ncbi:uncharacterized protein AB675_3390 [Cyphellophora attinorum]|uniref:Uncharacterized protein n=1 Tax=Cyphellophora attinorum TaxID=1664694 RepID=A0A0N1NY93_9EURO|nr:uncharacterized protein AB675_3390 [Phialophora attinorum]KPI39712.1 hypothetical protein AB675_3390 [Phialophora attinorum]
MTRRNRKKAATVHAHGHKHSDDSCCRSGPSHEVEKIHSHHVLDSPNESDIEKDGQFSHVLLNVVGMDCTGCANNLARALRVPGTRNVQVAFVIGIAELDVDLKKTSIELSSVLGNGQLATN